MYVQIGQVLFPCTGSDGMSSLQRNLGDRSSQKAAAIGDKEDFFIGVAVQRFNKV